MKIDAGASYFFASQWNHALARTGDHAFASLLSQRTAGTNDPASSPAGSGGPDFTRMTRQELFDWMNGQIRSGDMTLDESTPFLGMTVKFSAATGQPVDMATDTTRIDFTDMAQRGMEFYLSRFDYAAAERLQAALAMMQRCQGLDAGI